MPESGWYIPDLGEEVDLPESFFVTLENMGEACKRADEYAEQLERATQEVLREGIWLD